RRRRRKIPSPRLQAGEKEAATDTSPRSGRQKSLWTRVCRPLCGLAPRAVTVPPPEGGGYRSFAAYGGTDSLSSNLRIGIEGPAYVRWGSFAALRRFA